jgi:hypothetical protein
VSINELFELIRNEKTDDNTGQLLCEHLIKLPVRRANADYYTTVQEPIDLNKIQHRLKTNEYKTFQDFDTDMQLLFSNSKLFHKVSLALFCNFYFIFQIIMFIIFHYYQEIIY